MPVEQLTKSDFLEKACTVDEPVLIEFFTPDCVSCRELEPVLSNVADEVSTDGGGKIYSVNISEEKELSEYYKIVSVPTTIALKRGVVITRCLGCLRKETIIDMLSMAS